MEFTAILIVLIAIGVGVLIYQSPKRRKQRQTRSLRAQLRKMTHGDAALMRRLVRYEREQSPNISETEALRRALERWRLERG